MTLPSLQIQHVDTSTDLQHVQAYNVTQGRRNLTDLYRGGTGMISGRRPDLLPTMSIGDDLIVSLNYGDLAYEFVNTYRVADVRIMYAEVAAADTWEIDIEDAFAYLGRGTVTYTATGGDSVFDTADAACSQNGITLVENGTTLSYSSAQTITNQNALDVFQTAANTEQARVYAGGDNLAWYARDYWQNNLATVTFSDDGTGDFTYNALDFGSLADNYADQVIVYPRGTSEVVSGSGVFSYNLDSYSFDTAEAQYLGQYLLGSIGGALVKVPRPRTITYLANTQSVPYKFAPIGALKLFAIKFRTSTYYCIAEGYQLFATPAEIRISVFLSDASFYQFFVLDDSIFGKLDENKLGW